MPDFDAVIKNSTIVDAQQELTTAGQAQRSFNASRYRFGDAPDAAITILGSRSDATGSLFWPSRLRCPQTGGTVSDTILATTGVLWSWTFVHAPWPGDMTPNGRPDSYGVGLVDLDGGGPRVVGALVGDQTEWAVGERISAVELPYLVIDGELKSLLAFRSTR
jgi:uncharacterized OB-fold protein